MNACGDVVLLGKTTGGTKAPPYIIIARFFRFIASPCEYGLWQL